MIHVISHKFDARMDSLKLAHVTGQIWCRDGAILEYIVNRFGWHGQRGEMIHVSEGRIRPPVGNYVVHRVGFWRDTAIRARGKESRLLMKMMGAPRWNGFRGWSYFSFPRSAALAGRRADLPSKKEHIVRI